MGGSQLGCVGVELFGVVAGGSIDVCGDIGEW